MVCAHCGEKLVTDDPMGFVHVISRSMYGEDGHAVVPITMAAWAAAAMVRQARRE